MNRNQAGVAGLAAAALGVAAGQLLAAAIEPGAGPVVAVASAVVDLSPTPLKEWATATLGTADKPVLVAGVIAVLTALAVVTGRIARHRPGLATVVVCAVGLAGVLAAVTRPSAGSFSAVPSLVAIAVTAGTLRWQRPRQTPGDPSPDSSFDRRLLLSGAAGAVAATAAAAVSAGPSTSQDDSTVVIPRPAESQAPLPAGLERTVDGISPLRTPVRDFYRVDTALVLPRLDSRTWRLAVTGLVAQPFELGWAELLQLPLIERDITLTCVSNEIGGPYCGSTRWTGVRVSDLLRRAQPNPAADQVLSTSIDGFTASTPLAVLLDGRDAMVAVAMDGAPLPWEHGFPARLLTPGLYGYVGATKWLTELRVTTFAADEAYWTIRGWAEQAPVKTACRIDTPRGHVPAGRVAIGGVAWATHRGISKVEVQIDGGPWQPAQLGPDVGLDYWRQWYLPWDAAAGAHRLAARAWDGSGVPQTAQVQGVLPDGATGYHVVDVTVG